MNHEPLNNPTCLKKYKCFSFCGSSKNDYKPKFKYTEKGYFGRKQILRHITNFNAGQAIIESGMMKFGAKDWFGKGIYFAPSQEECLKKAKDGSDFMITASVNLGKSMVIEDVYYDRHKKDFHFINASQLKKLGLNSTIAKTNTGYEYVVYESEDVEIIGGHDLREIVKDSVKLNEFLEVQEKKIDDANKKIDTNKKFDDDNKQIDIIEINNKNEINKEKQPKKNHPQQQFLNEMSNFNESHGINFILPQKFEKPKKTPFQETKPKYMYYSNETQGRKIIVKHLTNFQTGQSILNSKLIKPEETGLFGPGIYFTESKDELFKKTKGGDNFLIIAQINLGKSMIIKDVYNDPNKKDFSSINNELLNKLGFNSVIAKTNSGNEYVAYKSEDVEVLCGFDMKLILEKPSKLSEFFEVIEKFIEHANHQIMQDKKFEVEDVPKDMLVSDENSPLENNQRREKIIHSILVTTLSTINESYGVFYHHIKPKFKYESQGHHGKQMILNHVTNYSAANFILESRKMITGKTGWFGAGIYFAETKEECLKKTRHGKDFMITVKVTLGKSMVIQNPKTDSFRKDFSSINYQFLQDLGFDSVMAKTPTGIEYVAYRSQDVEVLCGKDLKEIKKNSSKLIEYLELGDTNENIETKSICLKNHHFQPNIKKDQFSNNNGINILNSVMHHYLGIPPPVLEDVGHLYAIGFNIL